MTAFKITRRGFLAGTGAAGVGLALGLERIAGARAPAADILFHPNPFIQIDPRGVVSIVCHRSEMGQGIRSSLHVLIADELGADPAKVRIVQGDGDAAYGDQDTDGSSSIRGPYETVRKAAATARAMLVAAAAKQWKVPAARLTTHDDAVWDGARSLPFKDLVEDAARLKVPSGNDVTLRPIKELVHVGKALPQRDAPDVVTGRAVFAADVRVPDMLTAVVARPPVLFGKIGKVDAQRALAVPGVKRVVELPAPKPPIGFQALGGVAVVAEHTWAAMRGRAALDVTWDHGPNATHESGAYTDELRAAVRAKGKVMRTIGDADAALAKAPQRVEAEYVVPYLVHAAMEPPAAVARITGDACEVWACTQSPQGVQAEVAKALGFDKKNITVHVTLLGGGFGRKSFPDFAVEAALLAKETRQPVRVQWTREDDLRHSSFHTHSVQSLAAGIDKGKVVAWRHRCAYPPIGSTFDPKADTADDELGMGATDLPLAVPNVSVEVGKAPAHVRIGWLRSVDNIQQAFAVGAFVDELAHEVKRDPRDMLVELVGPARVLTAASLGVKKLDTNYGNPVAKTPYDVARLHRVIEKVSDMCGWDRARKDGRAIGMHAHSSFASWVAVACEVGKGPRGELRVERAWVAADCGLVVNPDRVRFQMEGAVVFAMSNALHGKITIKDGAVVERNFHDYRLLRMPEAPREIHVELIPSEAYPGGAGEPGVPPVAPAIANAWFALTGVRLRSFPFVS